MLGCAAVGRSVSADLQGIWNIRIDDSSFEPVSKDAKRQDYIQWSQNLMQWQANSVEQAQRTGDTRTAINIDWNEVVLRGSEHFSENYSRFILPATMPAPTVQSQAEEAVEPPMPPAQNAQEEAQESPASMPPMPPMTAESALADLQA